MLGEGDELIADGEMAAWAARGAQL